MKRLLIVIVLALGLFATSSVIDIPTETAAAEASAAAPCASMGHYDKYWTSHGTRHVADYRSHVGLWDTYSVYHLQFVTGPPYVIANFVGQATCLH